MTPRVTPCLILPAALAALAALLGAPVSAEASPAAVPGSVVQVSGVQGCYTVDGSSSAGPGTCRNIRGGGEATTVVISPDGRSAYLVGYGASTVNPATSKPVLSVFSRNVRTGVLHQLPGRAGCLSRNAGDEDGPATCTRVRDLDTGDATSIVISADGRFVYVASQYENSSNADIGGIAIFSRNLKTGALHQLRGLPGCVSADGSSNEGPGTCAVGREVDGVSNVHITPDQKYLYASVYDEQPHSGIAIFRRNPRTGALRQLRGKEGCVTDNGTTAQSGAATVCRAMPNLGDPWDVATPGNRFAYIPDRTDHLVQAFRRDAKGGLVPLHGTGACVSDNGSSPLGPNTCVAGRGLEDVERALPSQNGAFLYTNSFDAPSPIAVLNRNRATGLLSQRSGSAACISEDGTTGDSALHCRTGRDIAGGYAGMLSPDGKTLYFAENGTGPVLGGLAIFRVSRLSGAFSQLPGKLGCVSPDGTSQDGPGTCRKARAIRAAYQVTVASGGRDVYVAAGRSNGIDFLHAAP
jgi:WD40-like Beta Propeller Repeat